MSQGETIHRTLRCVVVTPERAVLDEAADFVAVPLYDGEAGMLPGRLPLIGRLGYGELRYRRGKAEHRYYVDGPGARSRPASHCGQGIRRRRRWRTLVEPAGASGSRISAA